MASRRRTVRVVVAIAEAINKWPNICKIAEPQPAETWWQDADNIERLICYSPSLNILKDQADLTLVYKGIPYNLRSVLPLEDLYLAATARHAAGKVAVEEQLELELLELAAVAVAVAPLPLAVGLKAPIPRPAEQLLKGRL